MELNYFDIDHIIYNVFVMPVLDMPKIRLKMYEYLGNAFINYERSDCIGARHHRAVKHSYYEAL